MYWIYYISITATITIIAYHYIKIFFLKSKFLKIQTQHEQDINELKAEIYQLERDNLTLQAEKNLNNHKINVLHEEISSLKKHKNEMSNLYSQYKDYIKQNSEALLNKFENFATKTLETNSSKFTEYSQHKLHNILDPLKTKIEDFKKQVNEYYSKELAGRASLNTEIKLVAEESKKIAASCHNLTETLRGNQKLQGNWGELILKKVLESSGLREGEEYHYQAQMHQSHDDQYSIVDVLISLPDNKHLVIDAKTSLKYYAAYQEAEDKEKQCTSLKGFLDSVKNHVKNLSSKEYQQSNNIKSPDFTIMFIPMDSAFILALQNDLDLQNFALKNNIIISSPSLLIAILKTIASLWKLSQQNASAQKIAVASGDMYNKFCSFIQDMQKIGTSLDKAKDAYEGAFMKLYQGKGNLIKRAESIKDMGIITKSNKEIPEELTEAAAMNEKLESIS